VRPRRDADDAVADDRDLLAGVDVLSDADQVGTGVAVIDLGALERAVRDLEDGSVGAESADAGTDDDAVAHRILRRAARGGVVNALVDRPAARDVLARQRQGDAVRQDVGRGLRRRRGGRDDRDRRGPCRSLRMA
jgi:hypothetical protein